jgi:hypothetical protein
MDKSEWAEEFRQNHKPTPLAAPCQVGRLGRRVPEEVCTASPPARRTTLATLLSGLPRPWFRYRRG